MRFVGRSGIVGFVLLSGLTASAVLAEDDRDTAIHRGGETFALYCASCHGEAGAGGFGPALTDLALRKDKREVETIIREPLSPMPPLYPATLADQDVTDIVAYLQSLQAH